MVFVGAGIFALTTTIFARASQLSGDLAALGTRASEQDVRDVQGIIAGTDSAKRVAEQLRPRRRRSRGSCATRSCTA